MDGVGPTEKKKKNIESDRMRVTKKDNGNQAGER